MFLLFPICYFLRTPKYKGFIVSDPQTQQVLIDFRIVYDWHVV